MLNLNKNLKTSVAFLVAGLSFTQAAVVPRQAHAIIAIATGGTAVPALIIMGAGVTTVPLVAGAYDEATIWGKSSAPVLLTVLVSALCAVAAGLVMLDESGAPTPDFQAITPAMANEARIEARSVRAFNRQLDRVNSVSESIARGIAQKKISDAETAVQYAHGEWIEARDRGLISKDTFTALNGLSRHAIERAQAAASVR